MVVAQYLDLWKKIEQFSFDAPDATLKFADKLANQQKWSASYTARVILEYRKFLLLCTVSPQGASPSKAVDEAWHLHLTYTKSYWTDLCKNVLGKELHHNPSKGGNEEDHKHAEWYQYTLQLYRDVFDEEPPADIWQSPEGSNTVTLSGPALNPSRLMLVVIVSLLVFPFITNALLYDKVSPFDLTGKQFLSYFAIAGITALLAQWLLQKNKITALNNWLDEHLPKDISAFQLCWHVYDGARTLQTSIVDLMRRELLEYNNDSFVFKKGLYTTSPANEKNPLVYSLLERKQDEKLSYDTIAANWNRDDAYCHPVMGQIKNKLQVNHEGSFLYRYGILLFVVIIAAIRMLQGISNQRPILFLALLTLLFVVLIGFLLYKVSLKNAFIKKCEELYFIKAPTLLHSDKVVTDFMYRGSSALETLTGLMLVGTLFSSFDNTTRRRYADSGGWYGSNNDCSSSSNDCSSSSSDSSSCSSDSGGAGCGGCSGGD